MFAGKNLLDYTNLFFPNDYNKNEKNLYVSILKTNMVEEASLEFGLTKIDETRTYLLDEIKRNALINEKYEKTWRYINYVEYLLILASTVTGWVLFSAFASLVTIPADITSFAVGTKICVITSGMKKYKSKEKEEDV